MITYFVFIVFYSVSTTLYYYRLITASSLTTGRQPFRLTFIHYSSHNTFCPTPKDFVALWTFLFHKNKNLLNTDKEVFGVAVSG